MTFAELVRLLEQHGYKLLKHKGSVRYYTKPGVDRLIRIDYHGSREEVGRAPMIQLSYSLIIEATADPAFYGFYAPDLPGFTGAGTSVDDCIEKARSGMADHVALLGDQGLPVPPPTPSPTITVLNERPLPDAAGF